MAARALRIETMAAVVLGGSAATLGAAEDGATGDAPAPVPPAAGRAAAAVPAAGTRDPAGT